MFHHRSGLNFVSRTFLEICYITIYVLTNHPEERGLEVKRLEVFLSVLSYSGIACFSLVVYYVLKEIYVFNHSNRII